MARTVYSVAAMHKHPDYGVPFTERREFVRDLQNPLLRGHSRRGALCAIISSIEDISHWLIALMNEGKYEGRQVLPASVLKATLEPAIALPNTQGESLASGDSERRIWNGAANRLVPRTPAHLPWR